MKRPRIETVPCRRCNRPLATLSKSIWGVPDSVRLEYAGLCSGCVTPDERAAMEKAVVEQIVGQRP